jgi:hypothetical protein
MNLKTIKEFITKGFKDVLKKDKEFKENHTKNKEKIAAFNEDMEKWSKERKFKKDDV